MATSPMMPGASGMPETEDADEAASGEAEICIKVAPDGALSVYMEGGKGETQPQPVTDIGQALKAALEMYRSLERPNGGDDQQQFAGGFQSETGGRNPRGMY